MPHNLKNNRNSDFQTFRLNKWITSLVLYRCHERAKVSHVWSCIVSFDPYCGASLRSFRCNWFAKSHSLSFFLFVGQVGVFSSATFVCFIWSIVVSFIFLETLLIVFLRLTFVFLAGVILVIGLLFSEHYFYCSEIQTKTIWILTFQFSNLAFRLSLVFGDAELDEVWLFCAKIIPVKSVRHQTMETFIVKTLKTDFRYFQFKHDLE